SPTNTCLITDTQARLSSANACVGAVCVHDEASSIMSPPSVVMRRGDTCDYRRRASDLESRSGTLVTILPAALPIQRKSRVSHRLGKNCALLKRVHFSGTEIGRASCRERVWT